MGRVATISNGDGDARHWAARARAWRQLAELEWCHAVATAAAASVREAIAPRSALWTAQNRT